MDGREVENQEGKQKVESEVEQLLRKSLTKNLNKISETNMDVIFKEIKSDFDCHPKNIVTPIFVDVFEKLTIVPEKVLPNIISCNCTVLAAIHQLYDNIIFGMILK
jgi:hypothetical protein